MSARQRAIAREQAQLRDVRAQIVTGWADGGVQMRDGRPVLLDPVRQALTMGSELHVATGSVARHFPAVGAQRTPTGSRARG